LHLPSQSPEELLAPCCANKRPATIRKSVDLRCNFPSTFSMDTSRTRGLYDLAAN
jgi:hypothetical protein